MLRLHPEEALVWSTLCWTRIRAGQIKQAVADCDKSLQLRPNHAETVTLRGFAHLKLGQLDRAIADYDAALPRNPKNAIALAHGRGTAKLKKADTGDGNADIAAAIAVQPNIVKEIEFEYGQFR